MFNTFLLNTGRKRGQDAFLPDEGVAIYAVDEAIDNVNDEDRLAIELIQADNRRDLGQIFGLGNSGDNTDLYPSNGNKAIGKATKTSTKNAGRKCLVSPFRSRESRAILRWRSNNNRVNAQSPPSVSWLSLDS